MAYDPGTADRIRSLLHGRSDVVERRVVGGGLGFLVGGHLCCSLSTRGLTVRVGPASRADALAEPHVGPLKVGRRETAAFVLVEPDGYRSTAALERWVARGLRFVATLP